MSPAPTGSTIGQFNGEILDAAGRRVPEKEN